MSKICPYAGGGKVVFHFPRGQIKIHWIVPWNPKWREIATEHTEQHISSQIIAPLRHTDAQRARGS